MPGKGGSPMRHQHEAKGATLCSILECWNQAIGEVTRRPPSIDENVVLAILDKKHAHVGLQDLWYQLQAVPHSVQVRCDKVKPITLDSIGSLIGVMHERNRSNSCNDCQETAGQKCLA